MGSNIKSAGCENLLRLLQVSEISFAYVTETMYIDNMILYAKGQRDFDVVEERLGKKYAMNTKKMYFNSMF